MSDLGDFTDFDADDGGIEQETEGGGDGAEGEDGVVEAPSGTPDDGTADEFETYDVSPAGEDRGIGVLSASGGLQISEDEDDTRLRAYVTVKNRSRVRVGRYLLASYPDGERLFCRITALEYTQEYRADDAAEIHARRAMRSRGIDEEDFKLMAELEPVAVLYEDDGDLKRRMTDRVPKPETVVRQAADEAEVKTGLKVPGDGVFVGHLAVGGLLAEPLDGVVFHLRGVLAEVLEVVEAEPPRLDELPDGFHLGRLCDIVVRRNRLLGG